MTRFVLFWVALSFFQSALSDDVTLVSDYWCPYICDETTGFKGYSVELSELALAQSNHTVSFHVVPWKRSIRGVLEGIYDGALAASPAHEPTLIFPKYTVGFYGNDFITRKHDPWMFESIESLKGVRLAVINGYDYGEELNRYISEHKHTEGVTVVTGDDVVQRILKMLISGRVDVYLETRSVAFFSARRMGVSEQLKLAGHEGVAQPLFIGFAPSKASSQQFAKLFDAGVEALLGTPELAHLMTKYGIDPTVLDGQ